MENLYMGSKTFFVTTFKYCSETMYAHERVLPRDSKAGSLDRHFPAHYRSSVEDARGQENKPETSRNFTP